MTSKREKQPHVWVVEMLCGKKWEPCYPAYRTAKIARRLYLTMWKEGNPNEKFRIRKYVRSA